MRICFRRRSAVARCGHSRWFHEDPPWSQGRKGGLGKDPERARTRAEQLEAIDPERNCPWPLDWQPHHRVLADLVDADGSLTDIAPGVSTRSPMPIKPYPQR